MKVIEQFCQSKTGNPEECEDEIIVTDDFIAVFDGATAKSQTLYEGVKPGKKAAEILAKAATEMDPAVDRISAIEHLNEAITKYYQQHNLLEKVKENPADQIIAVGIIYSRYHHEIWILGDCQCRFDGQTYTNEKHIDQITREARSLYIHQALLSGKATKKDIAENDIGREFITPLLEKQGHLLNTSPKNPYAFAAFNGFPIPHAFIKHYTLSDRVKEIILASDGYVEIYDTLEKTEKALQDILKEDPLCIDRNKGTKGLQKGQVSFDDRAYIRFKP